MHAYALRSVKPVRAKQAPCRGVALSGRSPETGMDNTETPARDPQTSHHLLANLRELMAAWFQQRDSGQETSDVEKQLADAAARQGLSLGFKKMRVAEVPESGFPVVLLEKGGASRLVLSRVDADSYLCHGRGTRFRASAAELAAVESGTVFFARAIAPQGVDDTGAPARGRPAFEAEAKANLEPPAHDDIPPPAQPQRLPFSLWRSPTLRTLIAGMVRGNGRLMAALAVTGLIGNILFIALPVFSMAVYDKVVPHNAAETMIALSIGVTLALITDFGLRAVRTKLSDAIALRTQVDMTARVLYRLLHIRMMDAPRDAAPLLLALRDLEQVCQILPALFIALSVDILFVVAICIFLTVIGGWVGIVPLIGLFCLGIVFGISHFFAERAGEKSQKYQRIQSSLVIDTVAALETIKAHHGGAELARQFEKLADQVAYAGHRERHYGALAQQASITIAQMMTVLTMVFSVVAIGAGSMTVGAMAAAAMIVSRVMPPLSQMIGFFHRLWHIRRGIERIDLLMEQKVESGGDRLMAQRTLRGALAFHNVSLVYNGSARKALDRVHFSVEPGEKIGLIGRIGCGKTSLLRMVARLAEPSDGAVSLDGYDVQQYDPQALRRAVGFLRQDARLFGGSPGAHLSLGLAEPDAELVAEALAISGAADFIKRHPKGVHMPAGADGQLLSGGERQAVALARLILGDPRIVLLDEPTASMDNALEAHVIKALRGWLKDRTLIVSTHRVPLLSLVDRIIVMDEGRIIADGPRDVILKKIAQPAA